MQETTELRLAVNTLVATLSDGLGVRMSNDTLALLFGVPSHAIRDLVDRRAQKIQREYAASIMGVFRKLFPVVRDTPCTSVATSIPAAPAPDALAPTVGVPSASFPKSSAPAQTFDVSGVPVLNAPAPVQPVSQVVYCGQYQVPTAPPPFPGNAPYAPVSVLLPYVRRFINWRTTLDHTYNETRFAKNVHVAQQTVNDMKRGKTAQVSRRTYTLMREHIRTQISEFQREQRLTARSVAPPPTPVAESDSSSTHSLPHLIQVSNEELERIVSDQESSSSDGTVIPLSPNIAPPR